MIKHCLSLLLLIGISMLGYRHNISTAYELPALDMMPFLERYYYPDFAENDFYTNSFSEPSPRYLWGYFLISVTTLSGFALDWYKTIFLLKIIFLLIYPVSFYYLLNKIYEIFEKDVFKNLLFQLISVFFIYLIVHYEWINDAFTVAWWKPYNEVLMPQTLSLFLGIAAILTIGRKYPVFYFFLFFSTCFHLSIGILFSLMACMLNGKITLKKITTILLSGIVFPTLLLSAFFSRGVQLSGSDFVNMYAFDTHSSHYIPSSFGNLIYDSKLIAFVVSALLLFGAGAGYLLLNRFILFSSLISLLIYAGSIFVQYMFVEIIPIRLVAILGPSRYTFLGYWMVVFVYGSVLTDGLIKFLYKYSGSFVKKVQILYFSVQSLLSKFFIVPYVAMLVCFFISVFCLIQNRDNPRERYKTPLLTWIQLNTFPGSVFIAPENADLGSILYISNRAVFTWQGFPFNEKFMKEATERHNAAFGSYDQRKKISGRWIGDQHAEFYRSHGPEYFKMLSGKYKVDYAIVESAYSIRFNHLKPLYADNIFQVYFIKDF